MGGFGWFWGVCDTPVVVCVCRGFGGVVVGVGLCFGRGWCKLFILLPVGELLDWVRRVVGCVWWFENSIVCTVLLHHATDFVLVVWWSLIASPMPARVVPEGV